MRACRRKSSKALAQNTGFLGGGYHGGGGANNRQSLSAVFRFVYFAARAFPIMRPKVTERPQQLPVDILRVGIVRTRVDARDVQAFNRLAIVVDSL